MADNAPKKRLVAAAEELLKASGVEISTEFQKKLVADLGSFKESVDTKLNTINQSLVTSRVHADEKANSLEQRIGNLETKVARQTEEIAKQTKLQNLYHLLFLKGRSAVP